MPKVTAICPTADRHKWIPMAVDCFLAQTFTDSELLILDDGHEPCMTPELQASLGDRVRYVRLAPWGEAKPHRPYRHTGMKRNICCEEARGEVIVHWDDDDWSAPNRIESQLAFMNECSKPFVGYHALTFWNTNKTTDSDKAFWYLGKRPYASGTSQCYLKSFWEKNKFKDNLSVGEDSDMSSRAMLAGQLDSQDGRQMIVARAHSDSTCPPQLNRFQKQFPMCQLKDVPEGFLKAIGVKR